MTKQFDRQSAFGRYLARKHRDLHWLIQLLGDNSAQFLREHEGQTIKLEMTIPLSADLIEEARAIDCFLTLHQAEPPDLMRVRKALKAQYQCDEADVVEFAFLGETLLKGIEPRESSMKEDRTPNEPQRSVKSPSDAHFDDQSRTFQVAASAGIPEQVKGPTSMFSYQRQVEAKLFSEKNMAGASVSELISLWKLLRKTIAGDTNLGLRKGSCDMAQQRASSDRK